MNDNTGWMRCMTLVAGLALGGWNAAAGSPTEVFNSFGPGTSSESNGHCVTGPDSSGCFTSPTPEWIASPFVPTASGALDYIQLATTNHSGTQGVIVTLVADNGGSPDPITSVLETYTVAKLQPDSTTNPKVVLKSKLHPALTSGTKYWLILAPLGYDTWDVWRYSPTSSALSDISTDGGEAWSSYSVIGAFDVYVD